VLGRVVLLVAPSHSARHQQYLSVAAPLSRSDPLLRLKTHRHRHPTYNIQCKLLTVKTIHHKFTQRVINIINNTQTVFIVKTSISFLRSRSWIKIFHLTSLLCKSRIFSQVIQFKSAQNCLLFICSKYQLRTFTITEAAKTN